MRIEENKKIDTKLTDKNNLASIDFELDAMDYALKNIPPQSIKISFEKKFPLSQEKDVPEKKQGLFIKKEEPKKLSLNSQNSNIAKSLNTFPAPNPNAKVTPKKKNSSALIIILSIILFLCLSGSVFYYFQYFSKNKTSNKITSIKEEIPTQSIAPTTTPKEPQTIHPFLDQTEELILANETLIEKIVFLKQAMIDNPALKESLLKGVFYQIKKNNQLLSPEEILQAFDISFPIETASSFKDSWLFIYLDENSILKTGLIFEILSEKYNNSLVLNIENELPLSLKNLFVEEDTLIQANPIVFQTNDQENRLRYFNFIENNDTRTIDWAKIDNYLFFTTSKKSAFKIISILEKNY